MLSLKQIKKGNDQFDDMMKKWIKKYNDLLEEEKVEEIELTGNLRKDGFSCQIAVEKYELSVSVK